MHGKKCEDYFPSTADSFNEIKYTGQVTFCENKTMQFFLFSFLKTKE